MICDCAHEQHPGENCWCGCPIGYDSALAREWFGEYWWQQP